MTKLPVSCVWTDDLREFEDVPVGMLVTGFTAARDRRDRHARILRRGEVERREGEELAQREAKLRLAEHVLRWWADGLVFAVQAQDLVGDDVPVFRAAMEELRRARQEGLDAAVPGG